MQFPLPDIGLDVPPWLQNFLSDVSTNFSTLSSYLDTQTAPAGVTGLTVTPNTLGNLISWQASTNVAGYRLWRNSAANIATATVIAQLSGSGNISSFDSVDQTAANQTRYYWVQAISTGGVGGPLSSSASGSNFASAATSTALGNGATAAGANAVAAGASSSAAGASDVAVGVSTASGTGGNNTLVGKSATSASGNTADNVAVGSSASATGGSSTSVGQGSAVSGPNSTAVGQGNTVTHSSVVVVGNSISSTAAGQIILGSATTNFIDIWLGRGPTHTGAAQSSNVHATDGTGANVAGDSFAVYAGRPTGSGTGGSVDFFTAPAGGSSSSLQTAVKRVRIDSLGNVVANASGSAVSTSATDGFTYIASMAGAPSGVPTSYGGAVPMAYDSTDDRFYIYNGGWKTVSVDYVAVDYQEFNANGTWTLPSGWTSALCHVIQAGGGGGGATGATSGAGTNGSGGGGGSSGEAIDRYVTVSGNQTVTVGAGGAASTVGGDTTFGSLLTAKGGPAGSVTTGGQFQTPNSNSVFGAAAGGGNGGAGSSSASGSNGGTVLGSGSTGGVGGTGSGGGAGGGGGCGLYGNGGTGGDGGGAGNVGNPGVSGSANSSAGGGGGAGGSSGTHAGGTGGSGGSGKVQVFAYKTH